MTRSTLLNTVSNDVQQDPDARRRATKAAWQRKQRVRRKSTGQCLWCSSPRFGTSPFCEPHLLHRRKSERERRQQKFGYTPWKPGGKGRPPIGAVR